jgi:hypothetical protein
VGSFPPSADAFWPTVHTFDNNPSKTFTFNRRDTMKTQTRRIEASSFTPQDRFQELLGELSAEYSKSILVNGKEDDPLASIRESADFDVPPHIQALIRLNKKVFALKKHAQNRSLNVLTMQKKAMEIATLALMAIVLIEE